ncbi:hypothetical protein CCS41_12395 [Candidatus Fukatsuia symbiotica]|uniref:Uncharacterized protein n=1 Tax=Candidatus Fukatsuia symbiotica TaxID=1878942 RepID=A0A2U8I7F0_9GAMM|nr:hypothetical protein [Candidatus Fukatsuia symbiotica]AWK15090.1 hypothetical protein CCS41_12395 [Candidatus Fukatsuia symbiotica]
MGGNIDSSEELIQRIESDPQAHLKLIEIQSNHEIELQRIQLMESETQLKERENARQRETTLAQAGKRDITPALLAYLLTLGILSALYYLFIHRVPTENKELIIAIVSALSTVWIGAMAYFHGSSAGSRAKDSSIHHEDNKHSTIEMR